MNTYWKHAKDSIYNLPIFGNGSDILQGAYVMRGATPGTNNGELIKASGFSATPDIMGWLEEMHDYSVSGDTLINGTNFVTRAVHLAHPFGIRRVEYDLTSKIDATQAVSTTTMTVTSLEDNIDAGFIYVTAGTGAGQTNYLTASASGSATLKAAFGTDLDTTSDFIKILPRFHQLLGLNSDGTKLGSQAAAGAIEGCVIDTYIQRNGGRIEQMDPTKHAALNLGSTRVKFFADVAIGNAIPYSIA